MPIRQSEQKHKIMGITLIGKTNLAIGKVVREYKLPIIQCIVL